MPRIVTTAVFETGDSLRAAEQHAARLKAIYAGVQTTFQQAAAPPAPAPGQDRNVQRLKATATEAQKLAAELKVVQSRVNDVDFAVMGEGALKETQSELHKILSQAIALRNANQGNITEAAKYAPTIRGATAALEKLAAVQRGASQSLGLKDLTGDARAWDAEMTRLEANRRAGVGSLKAYREELQRLQKAALDRANAEGATPAEKASFGRAATRAGSLINSADTAEAEKLASALTRLKLLHAEGRITAEGYSTALTVIAQRADQVMSATDTMASVGAKNARIIGQARQELEKLAKASAPEDVEAREIAAARQQRVVLQDLNAQRRIGALTNKQYERAVKDVEIAARREAAAVGQSANAAREYRKSAEAAVLAARKLRSEMLTDSTGGSLPFALNSVAFGAGGAGAGAGVFIGESLRLNEEAKQAQLTLAATAKFYKQSVTEVQTVVRESAKTLRQDEADLAQAAANLLRKNFSPEAVRKSLGRFSDAAVAAGLDATKAIKGASEAILSEQSRQLNSAGIAENLGPMYTQMAAAMKKGEGAFRGSYLTNPEARAEFDRLREQGKTFREAGKAASEFQFILKATDPIAGRTAAALNTLTGAVGNFTVEFNKFRRDSVEGLSVIAVPVVNLASGFLALYNNMNPVAKSAVGATVAFAGLSAVTVASVALLGSFVIQAIKVRAEVTALIARNTTLAATQKVLNTQVSLTTLNMARLNTATALSNVTARVGTLSWASFAGSLRAVSLAALPLSVALGAVVVAATAVGAGALSYMKETERIYDEIEQRDKEFQANLVARNGQAYANALNRLVLLGEVKGKYLQDQRDAVTPEESAAAAQRLQNVDKAIAATRELARTLRDKNKAEKGDATATQEQADAYKNLLAQLTGVQERFGDSKLTDFQKGIREAQREQKRLNEEIAKGEREYADDNTKGVTPAQAKRLREQAAGVVPGAIKGLIERQQGEIRRATLDGELALARERAGLLQDEIAKRQALLKVETRQTQAEYAERIKLARQNAKDPNLSPAQQGVFSAEAARLVRERDAVVRLQEQQTTADLVKLRQERAEKLLDLMKGQAEAEAGILQAGQDALTRSRDRALVGAGVEERLRVEEAFRDRALDLARQGIQAEAGLRRGEIEVQLQRDLREAATLGEARAEAERLARSRADSALSANRLDAENRLAAARTEVETRVGEARAAVVQQGVDRELEGIARIEGAQLAALERRYQAELLAARARGDGASAEALRGALDTIEQEARGRVQAVGEVIRETGTQITDFSRRLDELTGKAAKGIQGARVAAAKPFDDYINSLRDERDKLLKARASVTDPRLTADLDRQIAQLTTLARTADAARTQAADRAGNAFKQAEYDRVVQARAKLAERLYDGGEGDRQAYLAALAEEQTYWRARLRGMEQGSQEYEQAQARIEELRQKRRETRQLVAGEGLTRARQGLAELEQTQKLARTDAERNRLSQQRLALLTRIAGLEARRAADPTLKASERDAALIASLQAQVAVLEGKREMAARPLEEARGTLAVLDAREGLIRSSEELARLDAERLRTLEQIADLTARAATDPSLSAPDRAAAQAAAAQARQRVNEARSLPLTRQAEELRGTLGLIEAQQVLATTTEDLARLDAERLTTLEALADLAARQARDPNQTPAARQAAQQGLLQAQQALNEARRAPLTRQAEELRGAASLLELQERLATTEEGRNALTAQRVAALERVAALTAQQAQDPTLTPEGRRAAQFAAAQARQQADEAQRALLSRPTELARGALALLDAQERLARNDGERARLAAERLAVARQIVALESRAARDASRPLEERRQAEQAVLAARAQVLDIERGIREAREANIKALRDLAGAQVEYAATIARSDAEVTAGLAARALLTEGAIREQDRLIVEARRRGDTEASINALLTERVRLSGQLVGEERALARRGLELAREQLDLQEAQAQAALAIQGVEQGSVEALESQLTLTQSRRRLLQETLSAEGSAALTQQERRQTLTEITKLRADEARAVRAIRVEEERLQKAQEDRAKRRSQVAAGGDPLKELGVERAELLKQQSRMLQQQRMLQEIIDEANTSRDAWGNRRNFLDTANVNLGLDVTATELLELQARLEANAQAQRDQWEKNRDALLETRGAFDALNASAGRQGPLADYGRALLRVGRSREALTLAERRANEAAAAYSSSPTLANAERLKAAYEALTGAVTANRDAIRQQAEEFTRSARSARGVADGVMGLDQRLNPKSSFSEDLLKARRDAATTAVRAELAQLRTGGGSIERLNEALGRLNESDSAYRGELDRLKRSDRYDNAALRPLVEQLKPYARALDASASRDEVMARSLNEAADRSALTISGSVQAAADQITRELAKMGSEPAKPATFASTTKVEQVDPGLYKPLPVYTVTTKAPPPPPAPPVPVVRELPKAPTPPPVAYETAQQTGARLQAGVDALQKLLSGSPDVGLLIAGARAAPAVRSETQQQARAQTQAQAASNVKHHSTHNYTTNFYWQGQKLPTPPDYKELARGVYPHIRDLALDGQRRSGETC